MGKEVSQTEDWHANGKADDMLHAQAPAHGHLKCFGCWSDLASLPPATADP